MYINTFKYTPKDVCCQLCTKYVKKLGCTSSSQSPLVSVSADGENCARSPAPLPTKSVALWGPQICPWLAECIEAGVVGYLEAVLETFPHERRLFQRLNLLIKHYPGSLWRASSSAQDAVPAHGAGLPPPQRYQRLLCGHVSADFQRRYLPPHGQLFLQARH